MQALQQTAFTNPNSDLAALILCTKIEEAPVRGGKPLVKLTFSSHKTATEFLALVNEIGVIGILFKADATSDQYRFTLTTAECKLVQVALARITNVATKSLKQSEGLPKIDPVVRAKYDLAVNNELFAPGGIIRNLGDPETAYHFLNLRAALETFDRDQNFKAYVTKITSSSLNGSGSSQIAGEILFDFAFNTKRGSVVYFLEQQWKSTIEHYPELLNAGQELRDWIVTNWGDQLQEFAPKPKRTVTKASSPHRPSIARPFSGTRPSFPGVTTRSPIISRRSEVGKVHA